MALDVNYVNESYLVGRLVACVELVQIKASPRCIFSCSNKTQAIFNFTTTTIANIMSNVYFHNLSFLKLNGEKEFVKEIDNIVGDIFCKFADNLPKRIKEQDKYFVGYYQQKQHFTNVYGKELYYKDLESED